MSDEMDAFRAPDSPAQPWSETNHGTGPDPQDDFAAEDAEMDADPDANEDEVPAKTYGDEDDEDEDDDEEEAEEESPGRKKKRIKRRHKNDATRFLDVMAEVSDEDEEDEDEGYEGEDGFIETAEGEDDGTSRRRHALLDTRRQMAEEKTAEEMAADISKRYAGHAPTKYTGDMADVPQRLLMPSVHDASLWQVRVKAGREREIVFSLMRKAIDLQFSAQPLQILSAFQRDSLPGMVYVEARSSQQVSKACNGLVGVYLSRGVHLVPIDEMASLLLIKKIERTLTVGSWVRIRRGKYAGDLAQVIDVMDTGEDVGLKFIPRIDLTPRDDPETGKKRKKATIAGGMRPPQRLFNFDDVAKVYGRKNVIKRGIVYVFQGDTYNNGFIEKDFKVSALITDDVQPTLDEITAFATPNEAEESAVDLSAIAEASKKAAISVLQPGDHVEVFEGEQAGVHGVVEEISQDVVTITSVGAELEGQKIELPARSVRKRFKPGDHVKVMHGQNADETGLVVAVNNNVVTFLSDMSMQEVSVFSKDLREAAEVGSSTNIVGNYELHDLVQLDAQTVGVIFKTERDSFRVLDQNGQIRLVQPHQISMRRDSRRAVATDADGHEMRINDNMKENDGEGRKGIVLHIHQSFFAFLHNREIAENGGVFVTRTRSLVSVAPKGNVMKPGAAMDLTKMNPAMAPPTGGMVGSGAFARGPRDRLIGVFVAVVKGVHKGYVGTIKDTNGNIARVELHSGNKVISIEKEKLRRRDQDGKLQNLEGFFPSPNRAPRGQSNVNPYSNGPSLGRTPNPYVNADSGKTPAWNVAGRTPNPYADGGKTPAWNVSSKTPNPYADGGRTPAWNANSRTPNPNSGWGGSTPARTTNWGGATPRPNISAINDAWGSAGGWGASEPWAAPTPASAPTPGGYTTSTPGGYANNANTPGYISAMTPGKDPYAALTPWTAPTPGAFDDADTFDLHEEWMFDIDDETRKRVRVVVEGSQEAHYLDGEYEGATGHIVAGLLGAADETVTVRFNRVVVDESDSEIGRSILRKYLKPVQPTNEGDEVIVVFGAQKGRVLKVRDKPEPPNKTFVSSEDQATNIIEISNEFLAVMD